MPETGQASSGSSIRRSTSSSRRKPKKNQIPVGMLVVALMQPVQMTSVVLAGCLRGAGDNLYVAAVMMVCVSIIRPIASYLAVNVFQLGLALVWLISLAELLIRLYFFHRRFESGKWAEKRV